MAAKITASSLGSGGADFLTYIGEIGQALKIAETNLQHFRDDLFQVGSHLRAASASEAESDSRQAATLAVIPRQLSESVELIATRRQAAATAAGSVSVRSQHVRDGIARVISALQVGDATRQRMEHVQEAAELLAHILIGAAAATDAAEPWAAFSDQERRCLAADGCALQTAQLLDAADEFSRELDSVHTVVAELSADAREIVQLDSFAIASDRQKRDDWLRLNTSKSIVRE